MKYKTDNDKMLVAYNEAIVASQNDEVPIGSAAFLFDELIAKAHNSVINLTDPTAHAEIIVLKKVAKLLNNYRLLDIEIYSTVEPCIMCYGAMVHSRIKKIVYGTVNSKWGFSTFLNDAAFNHNITVVNNVLRDKCKSLMENYFKFKRR